MSDLGYRWRRFEGRALMAYSRLVWRTARLTLEGEAHIQAAQAGDRPVLWALWHGILFPFIMWSAHTFDTSTWLVVTVGDKRGEVLGAMADSVGGAVEYVDMAGNPVASGRAVLNVIRGLKAGKTSFICPDGPDGPAFQPKEGVFFMARKAQALVLPVGLWCRPAYQMKRWDRYLVPLPFSRFAVVVGPPIPVNRTTPDATLRSQIPAALHTVRDRAMVLSGVQPWR